MSTIGIEVKAYYPPEHPKLERLADGSVRATWSMREGLVDIFTYPGGEHGRAFTTLETYIAGWKYRARLPRAYNHRWFTRLCGEFLCTSWNDARARGRVAKDAWPC